ncbi:hypothetical protein WJX74_009056 [Apatococcus lobatus]|uniref:RNA-binding protein NOB1 n=1 Tax=Apatococcus lobatus TaxID=904363 RepID=A0AAW1RE95_9CHLO
MPFGIEALEPAYDSLTAVTRFARATGDLQSLSDVDLKVLALAHTLEHEAVGSAHLRTLPAQQAVQRKSLQSSQGLPGWGDTGPTWSRLDKLNKDEEQMHGATGVTDAVQELSLETSSSHHERSATTEASKEDAGSWERAAKSNAAARQRKRKEHRRQQRLLQQPQTIPAGQAEEQALFSQDGAGPASPAEPRVASVLQQRIALGHQSTSARQRPAAQAASNRSRPEEPSSQQEAAVLPITDEASASAPVHVSDSAHILTDAASDAAGSPQYISSQQLALSEGACSTSDCCVSDVDSSGSGNLDSQDPFAAGDPGPDSPSQVITVASPITCVTADFAMQNVLLQMGLQLQAPNGLRLKRVSRFVQRCSACFFVVKEGSGIFCPRCGNAALQKVEVTVGSNGEEICGVQKKHVLRGTRYSLPKPKGGKKSKDPILREDMMLQRQQRKPRKVEEEGADPLEQVALRASESASDQAMAARLPIGRRNPNERRNVRTNRRKR